MKIFTCVNHDGFCPVGVSSVIVASGEKQAKKLLDVELEKIGLNTSKYENYTLQELNITEEKALILNDGNY